MDMDPRDLPPPWQAHNIEAEQALIGAVLLNNDAFGLAQKYVTPEHFYEPVHQSIYGVMTQLIEAGKRVDPIILKSFLPDQPIAPNISVSQYLARLSAEATTIVNAPDYARVIREIADRRRLAEIAQALSVVDGTHPASIASEAIAALDEVIQANSDNAAPAMTMNAAIAAAIDEAAKAYQQDGTIVGVPTTLSDLDAKLGGMSYGDLVVLAGRPGMGKSAFATTMLRRTAEKGYKSIFVSLEMGASQLAQRLLSDAMFDMPGDRLPYSNMRKGAFHEKLFEKMNDAALANKDLPIHVEQQPKLSLAQIAARARFRKWRHGLDILVVDHLDLIQPSGRYKGNKVYELGEITAGLKALAKELGIVVILLCQLSREVEKRDDKRPILADLRSSGSIEQDADTVIFLYRKEYYLAMSEPPQATPEHELWQNEIQASHNLLTAIIAKQRSGPTGSVELFCDIGNNAVRDLGERR
jgi:replicative DNA helicase